MSRKKTISNFVSNHECFCFVLFCFFQSIYDGDITLLQPTIFEIDVSNDVSRDTKLRVDVAEDPLSLYPLSAPKSIFFVSSFLCFFFFFLSKCSFL